MTQPTSGHQTVDVVLKHYFRPGREDFRRAIESAMPKLLMQPSEAGSPAAGEDGVLRSPKVEILEICARNVCADVEEGLGADRHAGGGDVKAGCPARRRLSREPLLVFA